MDRKLTKAEIKERIEDINYHLSKYASDIMHWSDDWRLSHMTPDQDKNWLKGVLLGLTSGCHNMINQLTIGLTYGDLEDNFMKPASRRQKEQYSYDEDLAAMGIDVEANNIDRQANSDLPKTIEGETYNSHIKPWALVKIDGKDYPIFADDPGQQDYIRFEDGEIQGFGSYNVDTVGSAIYYWIGHIYKLGIKRIEEYKA